ncbi:hypothetical protein DC498_21020 [Terrimonas sp.]|uniref:hypothetical protein n=1 Tax=Terrimonas sp. TaxID=1914338 RepID=UPI000D5201F4|nr:hypothetical protein [Terrimonas sp.]PVD50210.1 hypothetical protein DC498_21020 [Terrimonas sp.]
MQSPKYEDSVFINCPFDKKYQPILHAIIYSVYRCGFYPRTATEEDDGTDSRLHKIMRIIRFCKYGIHDISRIQLTANKFPRFNMPYELGLFFGAKYYGVGEQRKKQTLVFEKDKFSYQKFISDLNGIDTKAHEDNPHEVILKVRDWLKTNSRRPSIPGSALISKEYKEFLKELPVIVKRMNLNPRSLLMTDYTIIVEEFIADKLR